MSLGLGAVGALKYSYCYWREFKQGVFQISWILKYCSLLFLLWFMIEDGLLPFVNATPPWLIRLLPWVGPVGARWFVSLPLAGVEWSCDRR
jgi:hypothetical protein